MAQPAQGRKRERGSLRESTPGPGGNVTHLSSHHCGVTQSFPLVLALAGTSLAARRTYTGLPLLTLHHMRWEWGSEGLPSSPCAPWMSSGPAPPAGGRPAPHTLRCPMAAWLTPETGHYVDLCVSLITELSPLPRTWHLPSLSFPPSSTQARAELTVCLPRRGQRNRAEKREQAERRRTPDSASRPRCRCC